MKNRKIKALIAVRSGSMRVKNKNIRPFAGSTLLELRVKQLLSIDRLNGVVVNSNDDAMLAMAKALGAEVVKRSGYYASNTVSMSEVYANMAESMDCDDIMYANVTNPLVKTGSYSQAIEAYYELGKEFDSLASVCPVKEFLWKDGLPLNYDTLNQPRSQDLPNIVKLTFAISILPKIMMVDRQNVIGSKPNLFSMDEVESLDIDTNLDFYMAENLYKNMYLKGMNLSDII